MLRRLIHLLRPNGLTVKQDDTLRKNKQAAKEFVAAMNGKKWSL